LRCAEPKPFDYLASPLTVEGRGVHDHDAVIAVPPDNRDYDAVPEGPDAALASRMDTLGVLPAEYFVAQRRAKNANYAIDGGGDKGDLDAARPGEVGEAGVVMSSDRIAGDFFGGVFGRIEGSGGVGGVLGHDLWMRLLRRRRDV